MACVRVGVGVRGGDSVKCGVRVQVGSRQRVGVKDGIGCTRVGRYGQDKVVEEGRAGVGVVM